MCEFRSAKEFRQVAVLEQTDKDVSLTQVRVRATGKEDEYSRKDKH